MGVLFRFISVSKTFASDTNLMSLVRIKLGLGRRIRLKNSLDLYELSFRLTRDIRLVSDAKFFETDINRKRTPTSITKVKEIFADKLSIQQNCHFFKLRFVLSQSTTFPINSPVVAKWLVCSP